MDADHFGNFNHTFCYDMYAENAGTYVFVWALANNIGNPYPLWTTAIVIRAFSRNTDDDGLMLAEMEGGAYGDLDTYSGLTSGWRYYINVNRTGTSCIAKIYNDSAFTVLIDTLVIESHETKLRYVYGFANLESGDARQSHGHVRNLDLQEATAPSGYTDYIPKMQNFYPSNNSSSECPCCLNLGVTANDNGSGIMNITFYSNYSVNWVELGKIINVTNGTYYMCFTNFSIYNHSYYWNVSVDDGNNTNYSEVFKFTTDTFSNCNATSGDRKSVV